MISATFVPSLLAIKILQVKSTASSKSGGGDFRVTFTATLEDSKIRDIIVTNGFKIQIHGPTNDAWINYLILQGFSYEKTDQNSNVINQLVYTDIAKPEVTLTHTIINLELQ